MNVILKSQLISKHALWGTRYICSHFTAKTSNVSFSVGGLE